MKINNNGYKTYDLYKILVDQQVILTYEGIFEQGIIKSFLGITEQTLLNDGIEENIRKKLFNVLMEALQNIAKHQKNEGANNSNAIFVLGYSNARYFVVTGNYIETNKIALVQSKLDLVNSLDKEGLKELYKKVRLNSAISDVGGAGLGFIDMARKSGNILNYQFTQTDDHTSFFVLMATVSNN